MTTYIFLLYITISLINYLKDYQVSTQILINCHNFYDKWKREIISNILNLRNRSKRQESFGATIMIGNFFLY